jgi:tetratricopeptide (TPR) repeat protein
VFAKRGDVDQVRTLLEWCIREHPEFTGAVAPYATVLLRAGVAADEVVAEIERQMPEAATSVRFMLGSALFAAGAMEAAERQYREVLSSRPHNAQARAQLAEALLHQRRYAEAAAEATQIEGDDAFAALGCRIELWALIASGDLEGARAVRARAARAGMSASELEVFSAWLELAKSADADSAKSADADSVDGAAEPRRLGITSIPLLGVILDTLLRSHEFETFETLTNLLGSSALPPREQRELLASLYLEHGFLASAAQEWMAVCESGGDTRAFHGLAQVSVANGQLEDAAVFAGEAVRMDPANHAARALLDQALTAVPTPA